MVKGPGAKCTGARHTAEASRRRRQILGFVSGAEEPVETLREYRRDANATL